jgi:hypothetical protein
VSDGLDPAEQQHHVATEAELSDAFLAEKLLSETSDDPQPSDTDGAPTE